MKPAKEIKPKTINTNFGNEEEMKLFMEFQSSKIIDSKSGTLISCNQKIRNKLLLDNKRLVGLFISLISKRNRSIAQKYYEDLQQEGLIGLSKAIDHFDPTRGIRFSTYAGHWVMQALTSYLVKQQSVVSVPNQIRLASSKIITYLKTNNKELFQLTPEDESFLKTEFTIPDRIFEDAKKEISIGFGYSGIYNLMDKRIVSIDETFDQIENNSTVKNKKLELKDDTINEYSEKTKEITTQDISNALYNSLLTLEPLPRLVLMLRFMGIRTMKEYVK